MCPAHPDFQGCAFFWHNLTPPEIVDSMNELDRNKIRSLYKQATKGNAPQQLWLPVNTVIWADLNTKNGWWRFHGMSREKAEEEFVRMVDTLIPGWRARRI